MRSALYLLYRRLARACMIALPDRPWEARKLAEGYEALEASRNANPGAADVLAEYAALLRYEDAIYLAAHNGNVRSVDPRRTICNSPFWRPGVPLGAAAEDARRWLAKAHKVISGDTLTILRAVVLDDLSLDQARKKVGRCSIAGAEHLLRNAADRLRNV
jgi:hypothetical protein